MPSFTDESSGFTMPLTLKTHQIAQAFYQYQPDRQIAKRVYLNSLAVQAVQIYLSWFEIATDLAASGSWNPAVQVLADSADLVIPGKGKVECRPVLPQETSCYVPVEVWSDRIAYIAVQLNQELTEATLLGFVPTIASTALPLHQLRSLDELLDVLKPAEPVRLTAWLQAAVEAGWQTLEAMAEVQQFAWNFRSLTPLVKSGTLTTRGKFLDFPAHATAAPLALLMALRPAEDGTIDVWARVCPTGSASHLPAELEVFVLDAGGQAVMQAQSRKTEMIQLKFKGLPDETFSIRVSLGDVSVTEVFVI